jgi:hypothetical protein
MAEASSSNTTAAWRQGYEAALRDVEQRAGELQERGGAAGLAGMLADLRAGLNTAPQRVDSTAVQAAGIPREELEREWTAG